MKANRLMWIMVMVLLVLSSFAYAVDIGYYGFESGTQGWTFGGSNGDRSNTRSNKQDSGAAGGTWSAHLQDDLTDSNFYQNFDFTGYDTVTIAFDYYPVSVDSGEYVQLLCDGTEVWRFTEGDHGQGSWSSTSVEITTSDCTFDSSVPLRWEGNPGLSGAADDLWVDGINVTGIVNVINLSTPSFEDWESYGDGDTTLASSSWSNNAGDTCDWQTDSAGTPSSNTGPDIDHTLGTTSGKYLFVETSNGFCNNNSDTAYLESDNFDADTYAINVSFWYHLYGSEMGTLNLDVYNGSWNNGVWSISGQQHTSETDVYDQANVDLSAYTGTIKFRFRYVAAGGYRGDVAIDDITVSGELRSVPDTTSPTINSVSDSPDPVNEGANVTITANVTDDVGVDTVLVEIDGTNYTMAQQTGSSTLNIALVCADASCTDANKDVPLKNHLSSTLGHTVSTFIDTDQAWTPTSYDAIVISESVNSGNTAWLKSEAVGILTLEGSNWDEFDFGTGGNSDLGGDTDINIVDNSHYITQTFSTGTLTVSTSTSNLGYISGWSNDVNNLAYYTANSAQSKLLYVESGNTLADSSIAAERRVFYGAQYFANLNNDGKTLFNRALDWTAYNTVWQRSHNTSSESGSVSYTVYANDTSNNVASQGGSYTVNVTTDTNAPTINGISDSPDPVDQGNNITIIANVTDDVAVSSVWMEIEGTNYTMDPPGSSYFGQYCMASSENSSIAINGDVRFWLDDDPTVDEFVTNFTNGTTIYVKVNGTSGFDLTNSKFIIKDVDDVTNLYDPISPAGWTESSSGIYTNNFTLSSAYDNTKIQVEIELKNSGGSRLIKTGTFANVGTPAGSANSHSYYTDSSLINEWTEDYLIPGNIYWIKMTQTKWTATPNLKVNFEEYDADKTTVVNSVAMTLVSGSTYKGNFTVPSSGNGTSQWVGVKIEGKDASNNKYKGYNQFYINNDVPTSCGNTWALNHNTTGESGMIIFTVYANDTSNNNASTISNYTVTDTTPPAGVTGLSNTSITNESILWSWTNPAGGDYDKAIVYIDGVNVVNLSTPLNAYNATGFAANSTHTITVHTADSNGNANTTDVNHTATTLANPSNTVNVNISIADSNSSPVSTTTELITPNGTIVYSGTSTEHNTETTPGLYNIRVAPENHVIKELMIYGINISEDLTSLLDIDDPSNNSGYEELYAINPLQNFTNGTVTVTATGNVLYKCPTWNFTSQSCPGEWQTLMTNLTPGQNYTFTINSTDPGFAESSEAVDVALAPLDNTTFVVAWIDRAQTDVSFKVMNTNGSVITDTVDADSAVDLVSKVSVGAINSTHFTIAWIDGDANDVEMAIYQRNGSVVLSETNVDLDVGTDTDISVAQMGDRYVVCYANDADNDADFRIYDNDGTQIVGETNVDGNMNPDRTLQNYVECAAVNNTRFSYFWFDDNGNDATYRIANETGGMETAQQDLDTGAGGFAQVAVTGLDNNKFAMAYYDSSDDDITIAIRDVDNTQILAPTDIDTNAGTSSRVAIATVRESSTSVNDSFVVVWWDQAAGDMKAAVYDNAGTQVTAPFTVDTQQDTTYRLLDVAGRDPITGNSICPGTFIVAYTNSSDEGLFKTYYVNGTTWDGSCSQPESISVTILNPLDGHTYNTPSLFIRETINGTEDTCWYNLNSGSNTTYTCGSEPSINASEGENTLLVYVNNSDSVEASDTVSFTVNSSVPLTLTITSPANGTMSTATAPQLKFLATGGYSTSNYTIYIYYQNYTLYSVGNTGSLTNNTETEITLNPALQLIGNSTTYKIYANGTDAGSNNATSNTIYYAITRPAVELVNPADNYWDTDGAITFSFRVYDENYNTSNCSIYINDVLNQTNESSVTGGNTTVFDITGISSGANQAWKVICTDPFNNAGEDTRTFSVDTVDPVINSIDATPDPVERIQIVNVTANVTDNVGLDSVTVNISDQIIMMTYAGNDIYYYEYNTSDLIGVINYTVEATDNASRVSTLTSNYTVQDTIVPDSVTSLTNISQMNASILWAWTNPTNNDFDKSIVYIDGSNIVNLTTPINAYNATGFAANSTHTITVHTLDDYGNVNTTDVNHTATTLAIPDTGAPQYSALTENPSDPATYSPSASYEFNATWTDDIAIDTITLEFGGINYTDLTVNGNVYSRNFTDLAAGTYNYKWYANDTSGQTNSTGTLTYTINKASTTTQLYLNGNENNQTITYGTTSNATATTSTGSITLYRNGSPISNPEITTLTAGTYNYTATNDGNKNYTASSTTYFLAVNKAAAEVNLALNGVDGNITVETGTNVNKTATLVAGEGSLEMRRDGSLINSGPSPLTNTSTYNTIGTYNITASVAETENYTAHTETHYIIVQDTTVPGSVTGLSNITNTNVSILWSWTNPADSDFNKTIVYIDDVNVINLTTPTNAFNATGFLPNTTHTITIHTADNDGNINTTNVSNTASTPPNPIPPDNTPPGSVSALTDISSTNTSILWSWTNPVDADFNGTIIYIDGSNVVNLSSGINAFNATGFLANTTHTITVHTIDTNNNVNDTDVNDSATTQENPDTTAPGSVTGLTDTSSTNTSILWSWTNPVDPDFNGTIVYIDGNNIVNLSSGTNAFNATGFAVNSTHTITVHTKDISGNVNNTDVNSTAITQENPDTTAPGSVTGLTSTTVTTTSILWSWTNPIDPDFNGTIIYIDGTNVVNLTSGTNAFNATGFAENSDHTITIHTIDTSNNINNTDVNSTSTTAITVTPPSSNENVAPSSSGNPVPQLHADYSQQESQPETQETPIETVPPYVPPKKSKPSETVRESATESSKEPVPEIVEKVATVSPTYIPTGAITVSPEVPRAAATPTLNTGQKIFVGGSLLAIIFLLAMLAVSIGRRKDKRIQIALRKYRRTETLTKMKLKFDGTRYSLSKVEKDVHAKIVQKDTKSKVVDTKVSPKKADRVEKTEMLKKLKNIHGGKNE